MDHETMLREARRLARRFRVSDGSRFKLKDFDPSSTPGVKSSDKERGRIILQEGREVLAVMQDKLYAQDCWSLLLVLQAMDAAGKDGVIKHVMSGVNPQGCKVASFKAPSTEELDHDFLWRCNMRLPARGEIGIFNRSYYEEVLVVRVHPEFLERQRLPAKLTAEGEADTAFWNERYRSIRSFERHLARNGTIVRKVFLNVSREEQKKRFMKRLDDPEKNWKFSAADAAERRHWKSYMAAYEDAIRNTATKSAPWFVVPADNKAYARVVVASIVIDALRSLDLAYPTLSRERVEGLASARRELLADK